MKFSVFIVLFRLETEARPELAPGAWTKPNGTWRLPLEQGWGEDKLAGPVFVISLEDGWWSRSWSHTRTRSYSADEVALAGRAEDDEDEMMGLGIVTSDQGEVVAYTVYGGGSFAAYDPVDQPHSDEGWYEFSISR